MSRSWQSMGPPPRVMREAMQNAALRRAQAEEKYARSAENWSLGPERMLTHAERERGEEEMEMRRKWARKDKVTVDAHRQRLASAIAIQASVMGKAALELQRLHAELDEAVRADAGNDYGDWHPVGFGGCGIGEGGPLEDVVALARKVSAEATTARVLVGAGALRARSQQPQ